MTLALLCLPSKDGLPPLCAESGQAWDTRGADCPRSMAQVPHAVCRRLARQNRRWRKRMVLVQEQHHWAVASDLREL